MIRRFGGRTRGVLVAASVASAGCYSEPPITGGTTEGGSTGCTTDACGSTGAPPSDETTDDPPAMTSDGGSESTSMPAEGSTGVATGDESDDGLDSSTGSSAFCGDGVVDPATEMCDGTAGCLRDCTFESYDCNPLGNAGCGAGLRCGLFDAPTEDFACMPPGAGAVGEACIGRPGNDSDCADGLTCLFNPNTPLCDSGNCCVEYCNLVDPVVTCSGGAECRPFFPNPMFQGLEHLGFCGEPL